MINSTNVGNFDWPFCSSINYSICAFCMLVSAMAKTNRYRFHRMNLYGTKSYISLTLNQVLFRSCTDIFDENVYLAIIDNEKVLMFNWKT